MLTAALIGALALAAAAVAGMIWAFKRSFNYTNKYQAAVDRAAGLESELAGVRGGIDERDHTIDELTRQATRLRAALDMAEGETPPVATKENAGATIRSSMEALRAAAGKAPPPPTPRPAAPPGSVTGGLPLPPPIAAPGGAGAAAGGDRPGGAPVHGPAADPGKQPK